MQCVGVWKYVSVDGDGVGNGYPATVEMEMIMMASLLGPA